MIVKEFQVTFGISNPAFVLINNNNNIILFLLPSLADGVCLLLHLLWSNQVACKLVISEV